jgi:hypothetical protein
MRYAIRAAAAAGLLVIGLAGRPVPGQAAADAHYFPETRHTVSGVFWDYWQSHGGLAQQGYPITEEFQETSPIDNKPYTVQYFERAVFEYHPENKPPYQVLLSPLGTLALQARYPKAAPADQQPNRQDARTFPQTGRTVGGGFAAYWQQHGGLAQFGYPLTDEFTETSATNGKPYTVQYFERAVFEYHADAPANARIMLSLLGVSRYHARYEAVDNPRPAQWPPAPGLAPTDRPVLLDATFATADLAAWQPLPTPDDPASWRMLNAHLQQDGGPDGEAGTDEAVLLAGDPAWTNIRLEAQFFNTSGAPTGVVWRAAQGRYYRLQLLPALPNKFPKASIQLVDGNQVRTLISVPADRFAGFEYGHWHTIGITAQGALQQVTFDGAPLVDVKDATLAAGQIGVYATADGATAFDNIRVQQLAP